MSLTDEEIKQHDEEQKQNEICDICLNKKVAELKKKFLNSRNHLFTFDEIEKVIDEVFNLNE